MNFLLCTPAEGYASDADCLVIGLFENQKPSATWAIPDRAVAARIDRLWKAGDIDGKVGSTCWLHEVQHMGASRILLVGLGTSEALDRRRYGQALRAAWRAVLATRLTRVNIALTLAPVIDLDAAARVRAAVLELRDERYRFVEMKSEKEDVPGSLTAAVFAVEADAMKAAKRAIRRAVALANGIDLARDLGNMPGNVCTPAWLGNTARKIARDWDMKVDVFGPQRITALKMGAFLSVARGSAQPAQLIVLQYRGAGARTAPVVLVGKGITFDSGGISLKPAEAMDEMKYDMCGAAAVLGAMQAVAEMGLRLNVVAIIPACENMPGGDANKPGDIVTSMKGLTIEVLNTDAEGRLILCDALTYAERFRPAAVIDVATLTGACVVALGHHRSGLFANDDALADALLHASEAALDAIWRLPVDDAYGEQLKSNFADLANIGGRAAGSITAACFLSRFAQAYPWAHLDIAGTAWRSGATKGATGRPVALLVEFLASRAQA
ncbi:leucyl aminopeptidase [Burkholderia cenocepacia]|nr:MULTISPECIES: leucyl aminopeptidase [Burkholderia cepacia complex]MBR8378356.1 leucyl aminopeptidase [Burkholderia cenocepacia]MDN7559698.1 leucyl aminopeptidase [Burkholderia orbicola]